METYYGHVRTPADAIILFEACRMGLLPRVQRRLSEKERQSIRSGSVFVWDEREAGMRRWTDGKSWSASRVSGSFLTYREMEGKRGGGSVPQSSVSRAGKTPESRGSDEERGDGTDEGPDGYRYKPDGLMKQSFSITTSTGQHLHLISYFSRSHPAANNLQQPTTDPALRHVRPQKGLYPESTVNDQQNLPVVTRGPMAGAAAYPITPHPIGAFPRTNPTHNQSYTQLHHPWPLTPLATPPTVAVPYPGTAYLPPVSNGASPYGPPQHQQPPHLQQPAHALPPPPHGIPGPYDRPAHPESAMPPAGPPPAGPPVYPTRSPRSLHQPPPEQRSPGMYGPAAADPRLASPRVPVGAASQANGAMHSPHMLKQTAPSAVQQLGHIGASPKPEPGTVPGIGSLMSGASLAPITSAGAPAPGPGSPPGARAPPTSQGPRDIPNEKIGFGGEDMRALRQLDRVFI
ncbi:uncharacterized protein N7482_000709 [Penicillium canariense]|uniref:cAMP-independent regulatory protein pac2 n=1 Tax=Penicillium canariense TaxID=189055 RepID=A0A9W9IEA1_9EURO|nr:uncharacterized protein N7482_000709 [Penicillium canariense]KAJ5174832.1 hypothetical protein N7482_000709 [Penicillium canariense]